jgi:hypothetical protein
MQVQKERADRVGIPCETKLDVQRLTYASFADSGQGVFPHESEGINAIVKTMMNLFMVYPPEVVKDGSSGFTQFPLLSSLIV